MKRLLRSSGLASFLGFALLFTTVEVSVRRVRADLPVAPGKWPREEVAQKLDQMDRAVARGRRFEVVFAGSSVVAGGIDPVAFSREADVSGYNAAWAGAIARTTSLWVRDILASLIEPDVVVIGLQSGELNDNGAKNERTYKSFTTSPGYQQLTGNRRFERWLEQTSQFLRYRMAFRSPSKVLRQDYVSLRGPDVRQEIGPRGRRIETPTGYHFRDKFRRNFYANNLANLSFGGREYRAVVELHRALEDRGIKLVFMATPVTSDYYAIHDHPRRDRAAFRALIRDFHEETGATVIDSADAFPTSTPFRDPVHLDVYARAALARALGKKWDAIATADGGWFRVSCKGNETPRCRVGSS